MEPPPKRRKLQGHVANESSSQDEVAQSQLSGHRESNTFDGIGIQSGGINVGGNLFINVGSSDLTKEQKDGKEKKELKEKKHRLVKQLVFSGVDSRKFAIQTAHASTCQWILSNHKYKRWVRGQQDRMTEKFIWLKGKPGTGKSTMMKFLFENIQRETVTTNSNAVLISFFFNARGNEMEKSTLGLYSSLLQQLFTKRPEVLDVLDDLLEPHEWTIDSLKSIFEEVVLKLKETSVICLIDALDECGESQIRDMVKLFNRLTQANGRLHVCFASRHYPHVSISSSLEIVLERQLEHQNDIKKYLGDTLQIGHGQLADQICSDILVKSSGIFMWVVLVVDILNREYDTGRKHTLRKRLEELPKDLHQLFREILTRDTENVEGLLLCLQWILFAQRPLAPEELYFAIISGLEPTYLESCHTEDISKDDIRKYILDNSKGLAETIESANPTVQFIHESVVDFLIKDSGLVMIFADLGNEIHGKSHNSLKLCCLKYIEVLDSFHPQHRSKSCSFSDLQSQGPPQFEPPDLRHDKDEPILPLKDLYERFPFGMYAQKNFCYHADQAEAGGIDQTDFMTDLKLGRWIWPLEDDLHPPSPLYFLAVQKTMSLIRAHPTRQSCFTIEEAQYAMPIMAAVAVGMTETAMALLEMEVRRMPGLSFQDLLDQVPRYRFEGFLSPLNWEDSFNRSIDISVQLARFAPQLVTIVFLRTTRTNVNFRRNAQLLLFHSIHRHHHNLLEYLINAGADLSLRDKEGRLPIHLAVHLGNVIAPGT